MWEQREASEPGLGLDGRDGLITRPDAGRERRPFVLIWTFLRGRGSSTGTSTASPRTRDLPSRTEILLIGGIAPQAPLTEGDVDMAAPSGKLVELAAA
jgi:hypothetical protein